MNQEKFSEFKRIIYYTCGINLYKGKQAIETAPAKEKSEPEKEIQLKFLIVDDSPDVIDVLTEFLSSSS